jgi:ribokinase
MKQILVLGSLNIDLVQRVPRLPQPGETLKGGKLQIFIGGKGANQACAAALTGGNVAMAGMVGNDVFADRLLQELRDSGVNTNMVRAADTSSGSAGIFVLPNGENAIVISPGANGEVSAEFARNAVGSLQTGDFLLCQLEIPLEAVEAAMDAAHERGVVTLLDPAPAAELPDDLLRSVSILTPNQTEAAFLTGALKAPENITEAETAARILQSHGAYAVIVKMGEQGCLLADGSTATTIAGFRVDAVDTTAAGDTFNGALATALAEGVSLPEAARFAHAAAALSVTKPGAIASIPTRAQVEQFLVRSGRSQ